MALPVALDGGTEKEGWSVVIDGVMGGKSTGAMTTEDGVLQFTGNINLDGGGFSSIRRSFSEDLGPYAGIAIEFETQQGGTHPIAWELQLEDNSWFNYGLAFANPVSDGRKMKVFLPFSKFGTGRIMGNKWSSRTLDVSSARSVMIYMLFQEGDFKLRVHNIEARRAMEPSPVAALELSDSRARELVENAITTGAPLYDQGYEVHCAVIYESALETIRAGTGMSEKMRDLACAGLAWGEKPTQERAWAYRRAMNEILGKQARYTESIQGSWINGTCEAQDMNTASPISIKEVPKLSTDGPVPNGADTFVAVLIILFMIFLKF